MSFSTTIVFAGLLLSDQDLPYAKTVLPILTNRGLQLRLKALADLMSGHTGYGSRDNQMVSGVSYTSLFPADWEIQLEVQFYLSTRKKGQLPDVDNLMRPLCNGLSMPQETIRLPKKHAGKHYFTLAVSDDQFTRQKVELIPFPGASNPFDLTSIRFTALPPPHLAAARSRKSLLSAP